MTPQENTIESCVARGAALLDKKHPGWRRQIQLEELVMEDCSECILGQIYGLYDDGYDRLELHSVDEAIKYGFTLDLETIEAWHRRSELWNKLAQVWKDAIMVGKGA